MRLLTLLLGLALVSSPATPPRGQPAAMQPGDFTPAAPPNIVSWQLKRLPPPSHVYITVDDVMRVAASSSLANELVTVTTRILRAVDGKIVYGQFTVAPPSNETVAVANQPMAEGFLLSASCQAAKATRRGQTFVRLFLAPAAFGGNAPGFVLFSDYVTTLLSPGFPDAVIKQGGEGPGVIKNYPVTVSGSGVDFLQAVPAGVRWRVQSVQAILTTDAVAGNRTARLDVVSGPSSIFSAPPITIPPSTAQIISWAPGLPNIFIVAGSAAVGALPNGLTLSGDGTSLINSVTQGLDAGDTWHNVQIGVEEWIENV